MHAILSYTNKFGNTVIILTCLVCSFMFSISLYVVDRHLNLVIYLGRNIECREDYFCLCCIKDCSYP